MFKEGIADVRFAPWVYLGRECDCLSIDAEPMGSMTVLIGNSCPEPLEDVRGMVKYFGWRPDGEMDSKTFDFEIGDLAVGQTASFAPPNNAGISNEGMVYVKVSCNRGVAVVRNWCSVWN